MKITAFSRRLVSVFCIFSFVSPVFGEGDLEEVTVTARKRTESFHDVPVAVSVFSEAEIESAGIEKPHDFIALTPNASIVQTQNAGVSFIVVRGISQARNSEPSVAILVDGVLLSNPAQINQELFDIEKIQFLKGPQGALYGRNAIGGAIIIDTKKPSDVFEGKIKAGADNGPGYEVQGAMSGPVSVVDNMYYRGAISYRDTDGVIDNPFLNEEADPVEDLSGRLRLLWEPRNDFTADFRFSYSDLQTQAFWFNIVGSADDTSLPVRVNNAGEGDKEMFNFSLKMDLDTQYGTLTSITAYDDIEEISTGDAFDFLPVNESFAFLTPFIFGVAGFADISQSQFFDIQTISQEIRFTSPSENRFRWIAGGYLIATDRFVSTGNLIDQGGGVFPVFETPRGRFPGDFATFPVSPQATFLADTQDNFAWSLFGEIAYDITENFEIAFSLRYDEDHRENTTNTPNAFFFGSLVGASFTGQVREDTWSSTQPKLSLRWNMSEDHTLYSTVSRGFRSGGFNQSGVGSDPLAVALGIKDTFDSEEADSIEFGLKSQWFDNQLSTNIAMFHTIAEGSYYFIFLPASSTQNLGNLDEVEYQGFEIELNAILTDNLSAYAAFGYTDSTIRKDKEIPAAIGNQAPLVSDHTVNIGALYHHPVKNDYFPGLEAFFRVDYNRIGTTYWEPFNTTSREPVDLVDVRAGFEVVDDWNVTFWSKNLFDTEYNAEFSPGGFVFKAPPRTWGAYIVKEF